MSKLRFVQNIGFLISRTSQPITERKYHSLLGRSVQNATHLTCQDIKTILWTAIELKSLDAHGAHVCNVQDKWVTILANQDQYYLPSLQRAAHMLGVHLCAITIPTWDTSASNLVDLRKYYERESDMLLTHSKKHNHLTAMFKNSAIPMFNIGSCKCAQMCVLTDFMTYQLHFGRLCGLNLMWFGELCTLINTYITMVRVLGINIRYYCYRQTPAAMQATLKSKTAASQQIKEFHKDTDKDYRVDVMVVREKSPDWDKMLALADTRSEDMIFLQEFPRVDADPCPARLKNRQKHIERTENLKYVIAAVMLRFMFDYQHKTRQPNF